MPCSSHGARNHVEHDQRRGTAASRGYGAQHRKWRDFILARDPVCKCCGLLPSVIADHVKPIRDGGARFDEANGQGLCMTCHNQKTVRETIARRAVA